LIQITLQVEQRARDLPTLNLNIDSKLCGCHVVSPNVEDAAPHGVTVDRAKGPREKLDSRLIGMSEQWMTLKRLPGMSRSEVLEHSGLTLPVSLVRAESCQEDIGPEAIAPGERLNRMSRDMTTTLRDDHLAATALDGPAPPLRSGGAAAA
jgi:hypothetical protein